eukprot:scaffold103018_cov36-Phaeocystis_antarctica.AAC.1
MQRPRVLLTTEGGVVRASALGTRPAARELQRARTWSGLGSGSGSGFWFGFEFGFEFGFGLGGRVRG